MHSGGEKRGGPSLAALRTGFDPPRLPPLPSSPAQTTSPAPGRGGGRDGGVGPTAIKLTFLSLCSPLVLSPLHFTPFPSCSPRSHSSRVSTIYLHETHVTPPYPLVMQLYLIALSTDRLLNPNQFPASLHFSLATWYCPISVSAGMLSYKD